MMSPSLSTATEDDPYPLPPDYDSVRFTGNYSDLGEEEEMRRDYERELAEWWARNPDAR
jgi:hypothetical protein